MDRLPLDSELIRLVRGRHGYIMFPRRDVCIGRSLDLYGEWAEAEMQFQAQHLRPGHWVLDVGAFIGTHSIFYANQVTASGQVFSFEPQRAAYQMLCGNLALNSLFHVRPMHCAVGESARVIPTAPPPVTAEGNFGATRLVERPEAPTEMINVITIDDLQLPRCDFIKIDAEEMELFVLRGAARTIARHRPVIYLEALDTPNTPQVRRWLENNRYRLQEHASPAFNADNFFGNAENIFGDACEPNLLALPR